MPIFDIVCSNCQFQGEIVVLAQNDGLLCPNCGSQDTRKLISATSTLTGKPPQSFPGPKDTGCCGQHPSHAGCAGPGSCCGRAG